MITTKDLRQALRYFKTNEKVWVQTKSVTTIDHNDTASHLVITNGAKEIHVMLLSEEKTADGTTSKEAVCALALTTHKRLATRRGKGRSKAKRQSGESAAVDPVVVPARKRNRSDVRE